MTVDGQPVINWSQALEKLLGPGTHRFSENDMSDHVLSAGESMTVFTATDDTGFQFQAAIPVADPPRTPPKGEIAVGTSPEGHALKFVHRGSYDGLDNTYEAITNYLDDHKLEAKDMFIEQYLTDPLTANEDHLVVNVYVLVK